MAKNEVLNNIAHKDLKVSSGYSAEYGHEVNCVLTFPTEYIDVQRHYPILFRKDGETGEYSSIALLGFAKGENLFLEDGCWRADYVPAVIAKGPFLIGFQEKERDGQMIRERVIHVDVEDPRVSWSEGSAVFKEHGGNTPYIERIASILNGVHEGISVSKAMFSAFERYELLTPIKIDVDVNESEQYSLNDFYTIDEEKLAELSGAALEKLNTLGFLQGAFLVIASLGNIPRMIDVMNRRRFSKSYRQDVVAPL